jgi:hypothetical protein
MQYKNDSAENSFEMDKGITQFFALWINWRLCESINPSRPEKSKGSRLRFIKLHRTEWKTHFKTINRTQRPGLSFHHFGPI